MKSIPLGITLIIAACAMYALSVAVFLAAGSDPAAMKPEAKVLVAGLLVGALWFVGAGFGWLKGHKDR